MFGDVIDARVHGWSPKTVADLLAAMQGGRAREVHGDFVLVGRTPSGEAVLGSSPLSATPYYWARSVHGRLVHGPTVFEVVEKGGLPWAWDRRAVAQIAAFDHPLGGRTVHPDVRRIAPGSWVHEHDGELRERSWMADESWLEFAAPASLEAMVGILQEVFAEFPKSDPWLSLSAGFDSRVLLGLLRAEGHAPRCACMGHDASTDRVVGARIASAFRLPFDAVELTVADYLAAGKEATRVSSGCKSARHFHTYVYAHKLGLQKSSEHFVGSNGEFARSFFFDAGPLARWVERSPVFPWRRLARARIRSRTRDSRVLSVLGASMTSLEDDFRAVVPRVGTSLQSLDLWYAQQRVRHFIGQGLAMYATASRVFSPFLDVRWMLAVMALRRADKLGNNAPRAVLHALDPRLSTFPVETRPGPIARRAPWWYPLQRRAPSIDYAPHRDLLATPEVVARVIESDALDSWISRRDREAAVTAQDAPLVHLLLTSSWADELGRAAQARGQVATTRARMDANSCAK